jgi:very-long-chain (3R)-3-hydroxyacyl-CoA dehydratase
MKKKTWLIAFNFITLLAWGLFTVVFVLDDFQITARAAVVLALAQGLAIIEIAHAIIGIAGSNWMLTLLQVSSRFFITFLVVMMAASCPCSGIETYGYPLIAIAWSLTEMVRALHYLNDLLHQSWKQLLWLRYSLFLVCYPVGVAGEFLILYGFWQWRGSNVDFIALLLMAIGVSYVVFFPKLFGHMLRQRKKKLGA